MGEQVVRHSAVSKDWKEGHVTNLGKEIGNILAYLVLPMRTIEPGITPDNRAIRNTGIIVEDFYSRFFTDVDLKRIKRIGIEKKVDEFGEVIVSEDQDWDKLREKLKKGKASKGDTERFLTDVQREIPAALAIISDSEACRELLLSPKMPINELICLSVISPKQFRQKPQVVEKAMAYLLHNGTVGKTVFDILKEYLLSVDIGIYQAVCDGKHVTPLINTGFYVDQPKAKESKLLRGEKK